MTLEGTDLRYRDLSIHLPLVGRYQIANCVNAVEALLALRARGMNIPDSAIVRGIGETFFPVRMEVVSRCPTEILDGAHNESGAAACPVTGGAGHRAAGDPHRHDEGPRMFAMPSPGPLPLADRVYTVEPLDNPRAMPSDELAALAGEYCADVRPWGKKLDGAFADAYDSLSPEDTLLVCGSLYVASDLRHTAGGSLKAGESRTARIFELPTGIFPSVRNRLTFYPESSILWDRGFFYCIFAKGRKLWLSRWK